MAFAKHASVRQPCILVWLSTSFDLGLLTCFTCCTQAVDAKDKALGEKNRLIELLRDKMTRMTDLSGAMRDLVHSAQSDLATRAPLPSQAAYHAVGKPIVNRPSSGRSCDVRQDSCVDQDVKPTLQTARSLNSSGNPHSPGGLIAANGRSTAGGNGRHNTALAAVCAKPRRVGDLHDQLDRSESISGLLDDGLNKMMLVSNGSHCLDGSKGLDLRQRSYSGGGITACQTGKRSRPSSATTTNTVVDLPFTHPISLRRAGSGGSTSSRHMDVDDGDDDAEDATAVCDQRGAAARDMDGPVAAAIPKRMRSSSITGEAGVDMNSLLQLARVAALACPDFAADGMNEDSTGGADFDENADDAHDEEDHLHHKTHNNHAHDSHHHRAHGAYHAAGNDDADAPWGAGAAAPAGRGYQAMPTPIRAKKPSWVSVQQH